MFGHIVENTASSCSIPKQTMVMDVAKAICEDISQLVWCIRSSVVNKWVLYANPFLRFEQESGFLSFRKPSNNVVNYGYRTLVAQVKGTGQGA